LVRLQYKIINKLKRETIIKPWASNFCEVWFNCTYFKT